MICVECGEPITFEDRYRLIGVLRESGPTMEPAHQECLLREVLGGIGHHEDHAFWCKTMHDPDGGRTLRQSALEVWAMYHRDDGALGDPAASRGPDAGASPQPDEG